MTRTFGRIQGIRSAFILESCLWLAGAALVICATWQLGRYELFQHFPQLFDISQEQSRAAVTKRAALAITPAVTISGRLRVPRLGMNVLVLAGDEEQTLSLGPARVPGTADPGGFGNAVIAGHRDAAFHVLRHLRVGDNIEFSRDTTYTYVVRKMLLVNPDDISVLANRGTAMLTLITCYPFGYIGDAPQRFVVQADLVTAK